MDFRVPWRIHWERYNLAMLGYQKVILALAAICLLPACALRTPPVLPSPLADPVETLPSPPTEMPASTASFPPGSTPPAFSERTKYTFEINLDAEKGQADVTQRIEFSPPAAGITLAVPPNRIPGVFTLDELRWADGSDVQGAVLEGESLSFPLREGARLGERQELNLRYRLDLPAGKGPLNNTGRQINFGDWYPFLPIYREEGGWLVHPPAAVGEYLVYDLADYDLTLRLANLDPKWVVAASAPAKSQGDGWHYSLPSARSFSFSVSDEYEVSESFVNGTRILSYAFPEHRAQSVVGRDVTADALALFSELYGEYPNATLSVVEADFPDGMEYDGLYFLGESYYRQYKGDPLSYLVAIAAHETAHQWFFGVVGNDPALAPWLDEALATYSELLYYQRYFPEFTAGWWTFRVDAYNPAGWVNDTIYDHGSFRPYVNAVYLRGAEFLRDLRNAIGEEAFFGFLRDYAGQGSEGGPGFLATGELFFDALSEHTDQDISNLVQEYFKNQNP